MEAISTDLFMEINGDLVWLVDNDEIDSADRVRRSYRNDVYPVEPPFITDEERKGIRGIEIPMWANTDRFFRKIPRSNFEMYTILRRRRWNEMLLGKIEPDIPLPIRSEKYEALQNSLEKLKLSDSFTITIEEEEGETLGRIKNAIYTRARREDWKVAIREVDKKTIRVWRIE